MWTPGFKAIAHMAELVGKLKDGLKFNGLKALWCLMFEGHRLVFVVPNLVHAHHSTDATDFSVLAAGGIEPDGDLCGPAIWENQQEIHCVIDLNAWLCGSKYLYWLCIENKTGMMDVVAGEVVNASTSLGLVETPVIFRFSGV